MIISAIVAASNNYVIGNKGNIPWKLRDDMKSFRALTMGHHLLMGRKTFDSIGKPLPGRKMMVLSKDASLQILGCSVFTSIEQAIESAKKAGEQELFIGGGAEIYSLAMPKITKLYFTRVNTSIEGDTYWAMQDWNSWDKTKSTLFEANETNEYPFGIEIWERKTPE